MKWGTYKAIHTSPGAWEGLSDNAYSYMRQRRPTFLGLVEILWEEDAVMKLHMQEINGRKHLKDKGGKVQEWPGKLSYYNVGPTPEKEVVEGRCSY